MFRLRENDGKEKKLEKIYFFANQTPWENQFFGFTRKTFTLALNKYLIVIKEEGGNVKITKVERAELRVLPLAPNNERSPKTWTLKLSQIARPTPQKYIYAHVVSTRSINISIQIALLSPPRTSERSAVRGRWSRSIAVKVLAVIAPLTIAGGVHADELTGFHCRGDDEVPVSSLVIEMRCTLYMALLLKWSLERNAEWLMPRRATLENRYRLYPELWPTVMRGAAASVVVFAMLVSRCFFFVQG